MPKRDAYRAASSRETDFNRRTLLKSTAASAALVVPATTTIRLAGAAPERTSGSHETGRKEQTMGGGLSQARLERMHDVMAGHVESRFVPGLVALLSRRGETHVDVIGTTAFDSDDPMRRDTIFRIASVTKPIVAVAAMILVEEGTLRLDEPVDRLLPELADRRVLRAIDSPLDDTLPANRPITLRDLLTFRLGIGSVMVFPPRYPIQQ